MSQPGLNIGYLGFNTEKKPFTDPRVRIAIDMAIDKKAILDAVYQGSGQPAKNLIPPTMWSYNNSIVDFKYDPDAAKKMLADAGYPDGFETTLWALPVQRPYNPDGRRMAELMQADLAKVGIKAKIVSYEWGEYLKRIRNGEHDMAEVGWTGDNGDPDNFFATLTSCAAAKSSATRWCNKEFDDLVNKAATLNTQAARASLYEQAQVIQHREAPFFLIAHSIVYLPMRKNVTGYMMSPLGRPRLPNHRPASDRSNSQPPSKRPTLLPLLRHAGAGRHDDAAVPTDRCSRLSPLMLRFLLSRVTLIIPTFVGVTFLSFILLHLVPGDPIEVRAGEHGIDPARLAELRHDYGLDQPLWKQFLDYEVQIAHGDLGVSMVTRETVWNEFTTLFPATIELTIAAISFALRDRAYHSA